MDSDISHGEFGAVNSVIKRYNSIKNAIKNSKIINSGNT